MEKVISYNDIYKRKISKEVSLNESSNRFKSIDFLLKRYNDNKSESDLKYLLKECASSKETAEKYFFEILPFVENNVELEEYVAKNIVPLLPVRYKDTDVHPSFEKIREALWLNNKCDGILSNHNGMDMKYNIEEIVNNLDRLGYGKDSYIAEVVMGITERYNSVPIEGKVQIALREFYYLANRYNIPYDDKVVTEQIVDIAIASNPGCPINKINNVADNNHVIDTSKACPDTCPFDHCSKIDDYCNNLECDFRNKIKAIDQIYYKLNNSCHGEEFNEEYKTSVINLFEKMVALIRSSISDGTLTSDDLDAVVAMSDDIINKQSVFINKINSLAPNLKSNILFLLDQSRQFRAALEEIKQSAYSVRNIQTMNESVDWSKIFKRENLVRAVSIADGKLGKKFQELSKSGVEKIKKTKRKIFDQYSDVNECMLCDGSIDYVIESWIYEGSINLNEIEDLCDNLNKIDLYNTDFKIYYEALDNLIEFHLIGKSVSDEVYNENYIPDYMMGYMFELAKFYQATDELKVPTSDDIVSFLKENSRFAPSIVELSSYAGIDKDEMSKILVRSTSYMDDCDANECKKLMSVYDDLANETKDEVYLSLEAMHMLSEIVFSEDDYEDYVEDDDDFIPDEYIEERFVKVTKDPSKWVKASERKGNMKSQVQDNMKSQVGTGDNKTQVNTGSKDKGSSFKAVDKKTDTKASTDTATEDEKKEKKPFKIDLNSVKLAIHGFKKKIKDLDAKQQQASRNADVAFDQFVTSVKKMLVSDRREAIIKGSVIPSFSRCIKYIIGLAGISAIPVYGPALAIITLFGGIAISKNLTKKERALLLDEIETEIEVLDREISNAESKNQLKRLRALLKTKKDLQRQYQRIKFNIRVGKDLIPSTTGTPGNN